MLLKGLQSNQNCISLDDMGIDWDQDSLGLPDLRDALTRAVSEKRRNMTAAEFGGTENGKSLPKVITFPYARHSSYSELCHLVRIFNPKDIYPCTVNEENWHEGKLTLRVILSAVNSTPKDQPHISKRCKPSLRIMFFYSSDDIGFIVTLLTSDNRSQYETLIWATLLPHKVSSR